MMPTKIIQLRRLPSIALTCFCLCLLAPQTAEGQRKFPGTGEQADWQRANSSVELAELLRKEGKSEEALDTYKVAIGVYADDPTYYSAMATLLESLGRLPEAEMAYRNAVQKSQLYADGWLGLANVLAKSNRPVDALAAYRQAYKVAPTNFDVCAALGKALIQQKRTAEGAEILKKAATYAANGGVRADVQKQIDQLTSADSAPPPVSSSVRLFKIRISKSAPAGPSIAGVDGLFAYSGPAGRTIVQKSVQEVFELVLIDSAGKRILLSAKDANAIIRSTGMRGLKLKGWAGEVRPVTIIDLNETVGTGSQFVIPTPI